MIIHIWLEIVCDYDFIFEGEAVDGLSSLELFVYFIDYILVIAVISILEESVFMDEVMFLEEVIFSFLSGVPEIGSALFAGEGHDLAAIAFSNKI